jgi:hypothetical protein
MFDGTLEMWRLWIALNAKQLVPYWDISRIPYVIITSACHQHGQSQQTYVSQHPFPLVEEHWEERFPHFTIELFPITLLEN